jgi:hypothetical protein
MSETNTEPTNRQLANFLVVYAKQIPLFDGLALNIGILERQLEFGVYREAALKHHRQFQKQVDKMFEAVKAGQHQCEHIRPNGKRCPNFNVPDDIYCGLHNE